MTGKKAVATFLVLMGFILGSAVGGRAEQLLATGDILQQIIDLVVENNPTLQSQRSLMEQIQALPDPSKGVDFQLSLRGGMATYADEDNREIWSGPTGNAVLEIPLFSRSRRKERIMDRMTYAKEVEKAKQDYLALKKSTVSELLTKLKSLLELENEIKKLEELRSFLSSNTEPLKQQVKTGLIKPSELWELTERIMDTEAQIYNRSSDLEILKREIAINLGGEKSEELRQMLEQFTGKYTEEKKS
ncbi:MAG: TolC family protein [bacterium]